MVEGALETARKDFARVMREVMNLQRLQQAAEEPPRSERRQRGLIALTPSPKAARIAGPKRPAIFYVRHG